MAVAVGQMLDSSAGRLGIWLGTATRVAAAVEVGGTEEEAVVVAVADATTVVKMGISPESALILLVKNG